MFPITELDVCGRYHLVQTQAVENITDTESLSFISLTADGVLCVSFNATMHLSSLGDASVLELRDFTSILRIWMLVCRGAHCSLIVRLMDSQLPAALLATFVSFAIFNVFFHPLRRFPGPKTAAATPLPFAWRLCNGRMANWTSALHEQYGEVVRIHPNELSFAGHAAWQDIYGCRPELRKPDVGTILHPNGIPPLPLVIDTKDHSRQKRILNHAFSERALKSQEFLLHKHTDILVSRLTDHIRQQNGSSEIDICSWYYRTTFDIIGDLCFSETFHSLESAEKHPWLEAVYEGVKWGKILTAFDHFPPLGTMIRRCARYAVQDSLQQNFDWARQKIDRRIARKLDSPDFLRYILENNDKEGMTKDEIDSTIHLLLLTGSGDTAAAAMTALTYLVLKEPEVIDQLQKEIRSVVGDSPEKITIAAVSKLEYLDAVLREAMRMHAPVPNSLPRIVDRPGVHVCGILIPEGTRVGIPQKTAYRLSRNFVEAHPFLPERWLPDSDNGFAADKKGIFEPFMVGPRRCIGKSLALAEMKLILSKVFWHFDFAQSEKKQGDWCDQRSYFVNERKPLYVKLKQRALAGTDWDGKKS